MISGEQGARKSVCTDEPPKGRIYGHESRDGSIILEGPGGKHAWISAESGMAFQDRRTE